MQTIMRNTLRMTAAFFLLVAMFGASLGNASAATLPPSSACVGVGTGSATCSLWAKSGTFTPSGGSATTIWGYTDSAGGTITAPGGPVLIVNQGDNVTINLTTGIATSN